MIEARGFRRAGDLENGGERFFRVRSGLGEVVYVYSADDLPDLWNEKVDIFQDSLGQHEIVMWNGHSAYGSAEVYQSCESFSPDIYQVLFINSCWTYDYYTRYVLTCKETYEEQDRYTQIDVVNSLNDSYFTNYAEHSRVLLFNLLAGCESVKRKTCTKAGPGCQHRFDWGAIIAALNRQAQKDMEEKFQKEPTVFGVSGARDNCYQPDAWYECPGVIHGDSTNDLVIPDNDAQGVRSSLQIGEEFILNGAMVELEIEHDQAGQLIVELEHDGHVEVLSWLTPGEHEQVERLPARTFGGTNVQGTWTLTVSDVEPGQSGRLVRWSLYLF